MQEISVYLNERASHSSGNYWKSGLERYLFRSQINWRSPEDRAQLEDMLKDDIDRNVGGIISIGGDGTVNTLIQNLAGTDIGLLVLPGGTANDLANELGHGKNLKKMVKCIREQSLKKIDLININGKYMATNGGIGFGGDVAHKINNIRKSFPAFRKVMKLGGKRIYSLFVAQELLGVRLKRYPIKITSPDQNLEVEAVTVLINNQKTLAGSFKVAPNTDNSDGKVNVMILSHKSRHALISCVLSILMERIPKNDPDFHSFETSELELEVMGDESARFFGDGEILGNENVFKVNVDRKALNLYTSLEGSEKNVIPEELTSLT